MIYNTTLVLQSSYEELDKLEHFLNELQENVQFDDEFYARLMLTISEAATNGVVHGNKLDPSKSVTLKATATDNKLIISVHDQGVGFVPEEVPNPLEEENLLKSSGRGVFLMQEYADQVEYEDEGRKLILTYNLA